MASHDSYDSYRPSSTSPPRHSHHHHSHHSHHSHPRAAPPPPLTAEAKTTIDTLKTTYKKRGHFDALRKDIYQNFADSEAGKSFALRIEQTTTTEIERDPTLLVRDKSSAAELLEGFVGFAEAEREVERMLAERRCEIEERVRGIMRENGVEEKEKEQEQEKPVPPQQKETQRQDRPQEHQEREHEMAEPAQTHDHAHSHEPDEDDMEMDLVDLVPVRDATPPPPPPPPPPKRERVSRFDDPIGLHRRRIITENGTGTGTVS
ncbi:complex proteins associated with Set1p component shg1-domain-containing protein [Morchella snyderi]|nr:complex proteins associated with Set1p component shg1-domain-containing protein [Morchella snyderi]